MSSIAKFSKLEEVSLRSKLKLQAHIRDNQSMDEGTKQAFLSNIPKVLEELGIMTELRNAAYATSESVSTNKTSTVFTHALPSNRQSKSTLNRQRILNHGITNCTDELDCIRRARRQWEEGICEEVNALAEEQGRPLARLRTSATIANDEKRRESMSAVEQQATRRFLFDGEDLLEAILQIDIENRNRHASSSYVWGIIKLMLNTPSLIELRELFRDLSPMYRQTGIDETMYTGGDNWADRRLRLGTQICSAGYVGVMRDYAKRGIPPSIRSEMWRKLLGVQSGQHEANYFRVLQQQVGRVDCLVDQLFRMDVEHCLDDDSYFPFDEFIETVIMVFSRDPSICEKCSERVHPPIIGYTKNGSKVGSVPPCGIQPFRGLVNYVAPLSFVYAEAEDAFFVFREMFVQYWCKLNAISGNKGSIIFLSKLFEDLLFKHDSTVCHHLISLGIPPLQIAFSWIQLGFVGYLQVDQVLQLWDRILGFGPDNGLLLLPILAVSIFIFRSKTLMNAIDIQDVKDILGDPSRLKVSVLLQHFFRV
jgi:hypothetical protein